MSEFAVRCEGIRRSFGSGDARVEALRGVDMEIPLGELTMVVGPSGCGKTTLLSIVSGILRPTAGSVEVFSERLEQLADHELTRFRRENLAFIFQDFNLLDGLTAAENVAVPLIIEGWGRRRAVEAGRETLANLGLEGRGDDRPAKLSGGEQQRVAVARALVSKPRLIVCDEPTASLDASTGAKVMAELRNLATEPTRAVIVVTHDERTFEYADSISRMEDGRVSRHDRNDAASNPVSGA